MAQEIKEVGDSLLEKYLTVQSGYMALILLILLPFVKSMTASDFIITVPIENLIFTVVILCILVVANFKDKTQEHATAAAQLANPKTTEAMVDSFTKVSDSLKKMELSAIKEAVMDCVKTLNLQPQIIEKEVIKEVPVEKIVFVPQITDINTTG